MVRMRKMMATGARGQNVYTVGVPGQQNGRKIHFQVVTEETFLEIETCGNVALKTGFWERQPQHEPLITTSPTDVTNREKSRDSCRGIQGETHAINTEKKRFQHL